MQQLKQNLCFCRDLECSATMRSIMENATHPERVHATVCQQIKTREEACLQKDTPHSEQVKTLTVPFFQVWLSATTRL